MEVILIRHAALPPTRWYPRPHPATATGYTSWRRDYGGVGGETYRFRIELDAVARTQTLQVFHGGQLELTTVGDIPYFDPSPTAETWTAAFGGDESTGRDVKPIGWRFCNLLVQGEPL